jgi:hypothetical protein
MRWSTSREEPQFHNIYEAGWQKTTDRELLHGVEVRTVSEDPNTGSATYMAHFPAGWRASESAADAGAELFVLEGDMTADGRTVGASGFIAVPHGRGPCELSSANGAYAFVLFNPAPDGVELYEGDIRVQKTWQLAWTVAQLPGSVHGRMYKPLRLPDPVSEHVHGGPAGLVHRVLHPAGFHYPHLEYHHESWEEMFVLLGDNVMPGRGEYGPGTYISNPAGFRHGMYMSQGGMLMVRHTTRPIDFEPVPCEWGPGLVEHYLDNKSLLVEPRTEPWEDSPERTFVREHPQYGGEDEPEPIEATP